MLAFPIEVLLGRLSPAETLAGLTIQAAWVASSLAMLSAVWRAGVRRYSAVGG
jgi:ABC-2 type transport system permease protein